MSSKYKIGDIVEISGESPFVKDKGCIVSKGIGKIIEILDGDYFSGYRRMYVVKLGKKESAISRLKKERINEDD